MNLIDNVNHLFGDDLKRTLGSEGVRLRVAASCFSIYAFKELKTQLAKIDEFHFIFTEPTFTVNQVEDSVRRERREFYIPKLDRERSLYGKAFEVVLKNQLTQRAIAKECAEWIREKAKFKSNSHEVPMQQFACVQSEKENVIYSPINGFTAVDLGYQESNAVSNFVQRISEFRKR